MITITNNVGEYRKGAKVVNTTMQTTGRTIRWASRYDTAVRLLTLGKDKALRQISIEKAQIKPGDSVLDVGCGTGDLTLAAKRQTGQNGKVYGIDAASEMVEVARSKAIKAGIEVDFRPGLIESLPFPDDSFDVVLSSLMMHHLPADVKQKGLREINRLLKPGGHLFVVDMQRPVGLVSHVLATVMMHGHLQSGVQELPAMMKEAGFTNFETGDFWLKMLGFVRGEAQHAAPLQM
jgi:ubiquinone/menaquinone biosynthesis C-methylase UbiE